MGNSSSNRSFLEVRRLEEATDISRQLFSKMYDDSKRKNGDNKEVLVDRNDCRHFINQVGVGVGNQKQVERAFGFFLHDGKMHAEELFSCVVMLSETMDGVNRLSYLIDTHNPKGVDQNIISHKYGKVILKCINEFYDIKKAAEPEQVWIQLCNNETNNEQTTREKFLQYLSSTAPYKDYLV